MGREGNCEFDTIVEDDVLKHTLKVQIGGSEAKIRGSLKVPFSGFSLVTQKLPQKHIHT